MISNLIDLKPDLIDRVFNDFVKLDLNLIGSRINIFVLIEIINLNLLATSCNKSRILKLPWSFLNRVHLG